MSQFTYFFLSAVSLYKLFYSVNLTNKLPPVCREIIAATEIVDHTNVQADRAYETCKWPGICWPNLSNSTRDALTYSVGLGLSRPKDVDC